MAIEDPQDLLSRDQGPLTWDFADINILEHKGNAAVVKAYFSQDDKVDEIKKVQGQLHQMKEEMVHWELILSEVNALYNKIKNASLGPDEIIAMQAELIQLQQL